MLLVKSADAKVSISSDGDEVKKNSTIRVLVSGDDLDNEAISNGIQIADELCSKYSNEISEVILFIPLKQNIKHASLSAVLGDKIADSLHKGKSVRLPSGKSMRLETIRTLKRVYEPSIVLAIYADQKMMDQVDPMNNLKAIVAVPYAPSALDNWKRTWSPLILGEEAQEEVLINDPIIESALDSLTNSINLSHTILNPRDKKHTKRTIRILRKKDHFESPENVRAWSIKNGWHPKAADELKNIWQKIYSLKSKPRLADADAAKKTYAYWKEKAK